MSEKAIDPFDVAALEKSLNDSAGRVSALWISFLIFALYLVVSAGTVTHRQLFLEDPVKLPVLNIDLPLVGFFLLAPILFVIFHAYMLLQVLLLGRTAAAYNEAIEHSIKVAADNARVRQRLANTLFVQIFAGSPRERTGLLGILLKVMAWITLAIAPALVLVVFQFKFLPYHSHVLTWTHRALILVDLAIVFLLWPLALDPKRDIEWLRVVSNPYALGSLALFVLLSLSLLTFPGEPHVNVLSGEPYNAVHCRRWFQVGYLGSYWESWRSFDRLILRYVDVVDDDKLAKIVQTTSDRKLLPHQGERTQILRGRDLNCSNLSLSDVRRVDLTDASIRGGALHGADLEGASLSGAQLQRVSMSGAKLQAASLEWAQLQGATILSVDLQGAFLSEAWFQGAYLATVNLQGASLDGAQFQGAALLNVKLQGASLDGADFAGASVAAELHGASLNETYLDGADLYLSILTHTVFSRAHVWRARNAKCDESRVIDAGFSVRFTTSEAIESLIKRSVAEIPDTYRKLRAVEQMRGGLVVDPGIKDTKIIEHAWQRCQNISAKVSQAEFDKKHAAYLRDLVCNTQESRGAVAKGIIRNWIIRDGSSALPDLLIELRRPDRWALAAQLARGLLGEDGRPCAATKDLGEGDKERLRVAIALAEAASPPSPNTKAEGKPAPATSPPSKASTK